MSLPPPNPSDPHAEQPVLTAGTPLEQAALAVILIHGRGGSSRDMMRLAGSLPQQNVCYLAPQAANSSWYPQRFIAPLESNEPHLSSALRAVGKLLGDLEHAGFKRDHVLLGGFSQGACLALEFIARYGARLGGVFALSGGLIGPPGAARPLDQPIPGTPIFLGCGDADHHIPLASVKESARQLKALGATVTERIYAGVGHIIVTDEVEHVSRMINSVAGTRR